MSGGTSQPGRSVTNRVLEILAAFEQSPAPIKVADIAAHADLPISSAHRLVAELVEWGALERHPQGGLRLGQRIFRMVSNQYPETKQLAGSGVR
ncbi:helix-turn-helix domain-containing protein [Glutamicibacter sp. PS]|uniref:helix-turn-helix domain-containing protein n=1 Tax=Glutamicibacter TaxID=1742989 RepID=UPI00285184C7|nr:helix-turn-helix domain-containing protein [Glutamicibacter sp. PS]MDR4534326.1 helix-turn-helix domain-containing protein [Glutamicibacter sp. PS]